MRFIKLLGLAFFAVLAFTTMAASTASAFHPLFLTESKKELLFIGSGGVGHLAGGLPTLRALNAGVVGTITCELVLVHGFVLDKSTLAHRIKVVFENKCALHSSATGLVACTEPIRIKELLGELGLVLLNKTVGILLAPSDGTKVFVTVTCGANVTTVEGAVIGEIPEFASDPGLSQINQYNKLLTLQEQVFEAAKQSADIQNITHIELLGVTMEGVKLTVEGFFGGNASEEARAILHSDGKIEICTKPNGVGCE